MNIAIEENYGGEDTTFSYGKYVIIFEQYHNGSPYVKLTKDAPSSARFPVKRHAAYMDMRTLNRHRWKHNYKIQPCEALQKLIDDKAVDTDLLFVLAEGDKLYLSVHCSSLEHTELFCKEMTKHDSSWKPKRIVHNVATDCAFKLILLTKGNFLVNFLSSYPTKVEKNSLLHIIFKDDSRIGEYFGEELKYQLDGVYSIEGHYLDDYHVNILKMFFDFEIKSVTFGTDARELLETVGKLLS